VMTHATTTDAGPAMRIPGQIHRLTGTTAGTVTTLGVEAVVVFIGSLRDKKYGFFVHADLSIGFGLHFQVNGMTAWPRHIDWNTN
jgi:hypothetical protein